MDFVDRQEMWRGVGDGFAQAIEFVGAPALLGLAGHGLDHWLGTGVAFLIAFAVLGLIGSFLRMYYWYVAATEEASKDRPWATRRRAGA